MSRFNFNHMRIAAVLLLSSVLAACSVTGQKPVVASVATPPPTNMALAFQADSQFGKNLSSADRASLQIAEKKALDYGKAGEEVSWKGKADDISGTIKAYQPFRVGKANCRRFEHQIEDSSGGNNTNGTACRRDDGTWRLVK